LAVVALSRKQKFHPQSILPTMIFVGGMITLLVVYNTLSNTFDSGLMSLLALVPGALVGAGALCVANPLLATLPREELKAARCLALVGFGALAVAIVAQVNASVAARQMESSILPVVDREVTGRNNDERWAQVIWKGRRSWLPVSHAVYDDLKGGARLHVTSYRGRLGFTVVSSAYAEP
jgi:hypothetical protein